MSCSPIILEIQPRQTPSGHENLTLLNFKLGIELKNKSKKRTLPKLHHFRHMQWIVFLNFGPQNLLASKLCILSSSCVWQSFNIMRGKGAI